VGIDKAGAGKLLHRRKKIPKAIEKNNIRESGSETKPWYVQYGDDGRVWVLDFG